MVDLTRISPAVVEAPVVAGRCRTEMATGTETGAAMTETGKTEDTGEHSKMSPPCVRGTCRTFRTKALSGLKTICMLIHSKLSHFSVTYWFVLLYFGFT